MLITFNEDDIRDVMAQHISDRLKIKVKTEQVSLCFDEHDSIWVEYRVIDKK